jgi:hypothetical protein
MQTPWTKSSKAKLIGVIQVLFIMESRIMVILVLKNIPLMKSTFSAYSVPNTAFLVLLILPILFNVRDAKQILTYLQTT